MRRDVIMRQMMTSHVKQARAVVSLLLLALACACSEGRRATPGATVTVPVLSQTARLGALAFEERLLSSSGRMSCATCHDPAFFHGPPNAHPVQVGGTLQTQFGLRAAPSLRYLERQPPFDVASLHGGLMADGRASTLEDQVRLPLFSALEFALEDSAELVRRLRQTVWGHEFFAHFGDSRDNDLIVGQLADAIAAFIREDQRMHPYDSKFDQVSKGQEVFSAAELRGRAVYRDPERGNCAGCHPDTAADGLPPLFTDFSHAAQGLPRNAQIPANADPAYFDLGLCGPQRTDLRSRRELCGMFRTPGLRNTAMRPSYFHNGAIQSLVEAVEFYNTRDTDPARWYPLIDDSTQIFDDLPEALRGNVTRNPPFGRPIGAAPPMNPREVSDLVCFLETLTDGHVAGTAPREACRD